MEKEPIYAFEFEGVRHDAGDKLGFLKATVQFGLKNQEFGQEFRSYLQKLKLGAGLTKDEGRETRDEERETKERRTRDERRRTRD
jgi:hypothetical protein